MPLSPPRPAQSNGLPLATLSERTNVSNLLANGRPTDPGRAAQADAGSSDFELIKPDAAPYRDVHNHECPICHTVWTHDSVSIPGDRLYEAHSCPIEGCGGRDTWKRGGIFHCSSAPAYCHNGVRTIALDLETLPDTISAAGIEMVRIPPGFQFVGKRMRGSASR